MALGRMQTDVRRQKSHGGRGGSAPAAGRNWCEMRDLVLADKGWVVLGGTSGLAQTATNFDKVPISGGSSVKLSKSFSFSLIVTLLCFAIPRWGFADKEVEVENEVYKIKLVETLEKQGHYGQKLYKFTFRVFYKPTGSESLVAMENMTKDVERVEIVNDRLLVFGGENLKHITIIDLKQGKEIDYFYCYGPQLSETKRY